MTFRSWILENLHSTDTIDTRFNVSMTFRSWIHGASPNAVSNILELQCIHDLSVMDTVSGEQFPT